MHQFHLLTDADDIFSVILVKTGHAIKGFLATSPYRRSIKSTKPPPQRLKRFLHAQRPTVRGRTTHSRALIINHKLMPPALWLNINCDGLRRRSQERNNKYSHALQRQRAAVPPRHSNSGEGGIRDGTDPNADARKRWHLKCENKAQNLRVERFALRYPQTALSTSGLRGGKILLIFGGKKKEMDFGQMWLKGL